jgi:SAM-dependent methyltransferase
MVDRPELKTDQVKRAESESRFYDRYAEELTVESLEPLDVFAPTCLENTYLLEQLGDLRDRRVLDIGCGQGDTSVFFALRGAEVYAVDVSAKMVELTRQLAAKHGLGERVHGEVGRVEELQHPDNSFDVVFADGVLHHIDMKEAVPNLVRMLKVGGRGCFLEPLKGSIFSQIYRFFAKDIRSADERPLERADLEYLKSQFGGLAHREFHLVSLVLFAFRYATLKMRGPVNTYWFDGVRQGKYHPNLLRFLQAIDQRLMKWMPFLGKYAWQCVITVQKPDGH